MGSSWHGDGPYKVLTVSALDLFGMYGGQLERNQVIETFVSSWFQRGWEVLSCARPEGSIGHIRFVFRRRRQAA